jgi:type IV pilus assembly protein PilY1
VVIVALREGGPGYIAMDVTDPAAGASDPHGEYPKLLWEFTDAKLGEAWSRPVITRVKLEGDLGDGDNCGQNHADDGDCREQWVAIFGGGYDRGADPNGFFWNDDPTDPAWTDRSRSIFMVALDTGEVLASVEFDSTGSNGPAEMIYALPSAPAVVDLDSDGFADVVYIGDLGGQMWKWDIKNVGEDSDADTLIDNWAAGVTFDAGSVVVTSGETRYRSIFNPPGLAFVHGKITMAFGTGEREDLTYEGDPDKDENNRFYVVHDLFPTGSQAFDSITTESDITEVTSTDVDGNAADLGYFFVVGDGEKFVTDVTIFGGFVIVAAYTPEVGADICTGSAGQAFLYVFEVGSGQGYFEDPSDPPSEDRRTNIGAGLPSNPTVSMAPDPDDDRIYIKTSTGQVITIDAPPRGNAAGLLYWRQRF